MKINANNVTNKYTLYLDNLIKNILEFTEISLYDTNANYSSYYISSPKTQLNIIYFNNENTYIIYITDISYFNYNLNLIAYCNQKPSENINLIVAFYIEEYDEKGYHISSYEKEVKKIIDNISNIFSSIIEIPKPSGYKLISISKVNIESNNGKNIYYIYFPNSTMHVNKDTSEYFVTYPTILPINISKKYTINIDDFSLSGKKLNFSISCNPILQYNIFLLLSIQIEKYNSSGNSIFENTGMKLLLNSNSNKFNLISEELNILDNYRISISNANLQYNDWYNKYYINYPYKIIVYNKDDENGGNSNNGFEGGNENGGNEDGGNISNDGENINNKSSSSSPIGMIIGVIVGILAVIGIVVGIIICKCKKGKEKTNSNDNNQSSNQNNNNNSNIEKMLQTFNSSSSLVTTNNNTGSVILKEPKENMRTFIFQTQKQDKEIFSIESDKSMKELRKLYLEKINHKELIENKNIFFLFKGKHFTNDTNGLIKDYFKDYTNPNIVIVVDNEDKL